MDKIKKEALRTGKLNEVNEKAFNTDKELEDYAEANPGQMWAGINWQDDNLSSVTIRMNQSQILLEENSSFLSGGFISLQNQLQETIINQKLLPENRTVTIHAYTQLFPQPEANYTSLLFDVLWALLFPFIFSYILQGL